VTYFPFCYHVGVHSQQNRRIICQYGGVDGRKRKLVSNLCPITILTEEIAVEVTEVVGVSPALWYFRYIASIFLTLHKRLCVTCGRSVVFTGYSGFLHQ
jgi:hypothetical protein